MTMDFFQENNITCLDHPAWFPDLNQIKILWVWMKREVYKKGKQFQTIDTFCVAVFTICKHFPNHLMEIPASNMPPNFFEVIIQNDRASHNLFYVMNFDFCFAAFTGLFFWDFFGQVLS